MGYVPPPVDWAKMSPEARAAYRAHLVRVLGYDPALQTKGRPWWRTLWWGITGK